MAKLYELTGIFLEIDEMDVDDEIEAQSRIDNIDELINKIVAYEEANDEPSLSAFLEEVALVADIEHSVRSSFALVIPT